MALFLIALVLFHLLICLASQKMRSQKLNKQPVDSQTDTTK